MCCLCDIMSSSLLVDNPDEQRNMIIEQRQRESEEMRIWIFITRTHERSLRPMRPTTTAYDSTRAFIEKNQVNVKKQMINYRASLRTQVYLCAPGRRTGKEEKEKKTATTTTTTSTSTKKKTEQIQSLRRQCRCRRRQRRVVLYCGADGAAQKTRRGDGLEKDIAEGEGKRKGR